MRKLIQLSRKLERMGLIKESQMINSIIKFANPSCIGASFVWIDQEGKVYMLNQYDGHYGFALNYFRKVLPEEYKDPTQNIGMPDRLIHKGWLRVANPFNIEPSILPISIKQAEPLMKMMVKCFQENAINPESKMMHYAQYIPTSNPDEKVDINDLFTNVNTVTVAEFY